MKSIFFAIFLIMAVLHAPAISVHRDPVNDSAVLPGMPPGRQGTFEISSGRTKVAFDSRGVLVFISAPGVYLSGFGNSSSSAVADTEKPASEINVFPWFWRRGEAVVMEEPEAWESTYSHEPGSSFSVIFRCIDGRAAVLSASSVSGFGRTGVELRVEVSGTPGNRFSGNDKTWTLQIPVASLDTPNLAGTTLFSGDFAVILSAGAGHFRFLESSPGFMGPLILGSHGRAGIAIVPFGVNSRISAVGSVIRTQASSGIWGVTAFGPVKALYFGRGQSSSFGGETVSSVDRRWFVGVSIQPVEPISAETYGKILKTSWQGDGNWEGISKFSWKPFPPVIETLPLFCTVRAVKSSVSSTSFDGAVIRETMACALDGFGKWTGAIGKRKIAFLAVEPVDAGTSIVSEGIVVLGSGAGTSSPAAGSDGCFKDSDPEIWNLQVNGFIKTETGRLMISRFPLHLVTSAGLEGRISRGNRIYWTGKAIAISTNRDGPGNIIARAVKGMSFYSSGSRDTELETACVVLNGLLPSISLDNGGDAGEKFSFLDYALLFLETHWEFLAEGDFMEPPVNVGAGGTERMVDLTIPSISDDGLIGCGRRAGDKAGFFFFNGGSETAVLVLGMRLSFAGNGREAVWDGAVWDGAVWDGAAGEAGFRAVQVAGERASLRLMCPPGRFVTAIFRRREKEKK